MKKAYSVLNLDYQYNGAVERVHPVVLYGKSDVVLVDCGYPGSLEMLEAELVRHGIQPGSLTKLLLTHQDDDHMGAAAEIKARYPAIQIVTSSKERPYISGELKNLRLQQAEDMQSRLPDEQKEFGLQFCERLRKAMPVVPDKVVHDGEVFDWGGGCEILETPGHTPGHISIRALNNAFIITGDAAVVENGALSVANPEYCLDLKTAQSSLEKLVQYQCGCYICYHGGILNR